MPEGSHSSVPHAESEVGPDLFAYYTREIEELFSQKEERIPSLPSKSVTFAGTLANVIDNDIGEGNEIPGPSSARKLFCNGVEDGLSVFKEERLKASLQQSVTAFGQETDETLQSVLKLMTTKKKLYAKESVSETRSPENSNSNQTPYKKQKISSSLSSAGVAIQSGTPGTLSCEEVAKNLRSLLGLDESIPDETLMKYAPDLVKSYTGELHEKMENTEKQLENYLNVIMSNCREMMMEERHALRKLIKNLPSKNLDRVAEIILQRKKLPEGQSCDVIHVDLEIEDNVTLWRLYYYAEAVERAKRMAAMEN